MRLRLGSIGLVFLLVSYQVLADCPSDDKICQKLHAQLDAIKIRRNQKSPPKIGQTCVPGDKICQNLGSQLKTINEDKAQHNSQSPDTFPESMLLEDIPLESKVQLMAEVRVKDEKQFGLLFFDGKLDPGNIDAPAYRWIVGHPEMTALSSRRKEVSNHNCALEDDLNETYPEVPAEQRASDHVEHKLLPGASFTIRGRGYASAALASPEDVTNLKNRIYLYNKEKFRFGQVPVLTCQMDHGKPTIGDLLRETAGLIRIVPSKTTKTGLRNP